MVLLPPHLLRLRSIMRFKAMNMNALHTLLVNPTLLRIPVLPERLVLQLDLVPIKEFLSHNLSPISGQLYTTLN